MEEPKIKRRQYVNQGSGVSGGAYGLGFIGAAIYFIQTSTSFWSLILGVIKAIFWPAFMVYELFKFLNV